MNDNGCYNRNNLINKTFNVDELKKPAVSVGFFVFCAQSVECRIYQIQKSVCRQITFLNKMFSKTKRNQKNVDFADAEERGNELMKKELIYQHIDHTLLKAVSSWEDIHKLCEEAVAHGMASVCIPPSYIKRVHEVYGDKLNICTVIGFPLGYNTTEVKRSEVEQAIAEGAKEVDMVVNLGDVKNGDFDRVTEEIATLKRAAGDKILKVIIETCYLTEEEKIRLCRCVADGGADYIKTSTGFGTAGAKIEDIRLFKGNLPKDKDVKMKAAGGVRTREDLELFLEEGCERIGTSSAIKILEDGENNNGAY